MLENRKTLNCRLDLPLAGECVTRFSKKCKDGSCIDKFSPCRKYSVTKHDINVLFWFMKIKVQNPEDYYDKTFSWVC